MTAPSSHSEPCCDGGPVGHTAQQHHDASGPCYDRSCVLDHPQGGPYPHPEDEGRCIGCRHPSGSRCGGCGAIVADGWDGR